jgi:hypothetical protein
MHTVVLKDPVLLAGRQKEQSQDTLRPGVDGFVAMVTLQHVAAELPGQLLLLLLLL